MIRIKFKYKPYEFNFKHSFESSQRKYFKRKVIYVSVYDSDDIAWGEISPLPELGTESYEEALNAIEKVSGKEYLLFSKELEKFELLQSLTKLPATKAAVELALINFLQKKNKFVFDENNIRSVKLNAVVGVNEINLTRKKIQSKIKNGFSTIKLKVKGNIAEDIKYLRAIVQEFNCRFRVDVNGRWSLQDLMKYRKTIEEFNFEYIEEPTQSLAENILISKYIKTPVALDESYSNVCDLQKYDITKNIFIVVKPVLKGGYFSSLRIINYARKQKIPVILSSALETIVGFKLNLLLLPFMTSEFAHGLATLGMLDLSPINFNNEIIFEKGILSKENISSILEYKFNV